MKKVLILSIISICFFSCQKEILENGHQDNYLENVKSQLIEETRESDYSELDFSKSILTSINNDSVVLLRIPFLGREVGKRFVLLHTDLGGEIKKGKIININKTEGMGQSVGIFNGNISFQNLSGVLERKSKITNGYVESFHKEKNLVQSRGESVSIDSRPPSEPDYKELPEIIVTGYYSAGGQLKFYDLVNLQTLINSEYPSNYYSFLDGLSYGDPNASSNNVSGGMPVGEAPILVDFESEVHRVINLDSYLNCFGTIPDNGAICSIELFSDVPVDSEPLAGFNFLTGSPGHTFVQLKKQNGNFTVTQNIGFYPGSQIKSIATTAPIPGVFVDNYYHEFNASIKMVISPEQLNATIGEMRTMAQRIKYDVDDYNCTDFALDIFNFARKGEPLEIPRFYIPETPAASGSNTPQGVYAKLKEMKDRNDPEAALITLPAVKGWVGNSHGSCN